MENSAQPIEYIRERFRAIGLGATFPRPGAAWTRLGDHIHWLDLIGIGDSGFNIHNDDAPAVHDLLALACAGVFPRSTGAWFPLAMPIENADPLASIIGSLSPRGRQGECDEVHFQAMTKIVRRTPSLVPAMLSRVRSDLRFRLKEDQGGRRRVKNSLSICSFLIEFGVNEDLELICSNFARFPEQGQVRIVCEAHARGWQREVEFLNALESIDESPIHGLHEALLHLREGGDLSDLEPWTAHDEWKVRLFVLSAIHRILPQGQVSEALLELLLPRLVQEDDSDCSIALGWALGRILERMGLQAALDVVENFDGMLDKDCCGFHAGARALMRTCLSEKEREVLLQALDSLTATESDEVNGSIGQVRLHLSGAKMVPLDLVVRLSEQRGWLQDLAEPGRVWDGMLGDLLEDRLDSNTVLWLCLDHETKIPQWLRSHWLCRLLVRDPTVLAVVEQATRPNDNGHGRVAAAHALLVHPGNVEPEALYLACATDELPTTIPQDSLRTAIVLLNWMNDPGLTERAAKLLSAGGPICREAALHWNTCVIVNDFNKHHVESACERLVELGVCNPPRPLGPTDPHSHAIGAFPWSEEGNDVFLFGDLTRSEPSQVALRLESVNDRRLLVACCSRLGECWAEHPEIVLAGWETLNERKDWEAREAALHLVKRVDETFLHGIAGERRRTRLIELLEDNDSDVVNAAKLVCARLGIKKERIKP